MVRSRRLAIASNRLPVVLHPGMLRPLLDDPLDPCDFDPSFGYANCGAHRGFAEAAAARTGDGRPSSPEPLPNIDLADAWVEV